MSATLDRAAYLNQALAQPLADAAGVSLPQTQAQRLATELRLRAGAEAEACEAELAAAYAELGGGELARYLTCDVRKHAAFRADGPKRLTAAEGDALLLEWKQARGPGQELLLLGGVSQAGPEENGEDGDTEKGEGRMAVGGLALAPAGTPASAQTADPRDLAVDTLDVVD